MKHLLFSFTTLAGLLIGGAAQALESATNACEKFEAPVAWSYCVTTTQNNENGRVNPNVLYVLHGGGGGDLEEMRADTLEGLRLEWEKIGASAPRIIQVSFGPIWALTPKDANPNSGLLEVFLQTVMPQIEKVALKSTVQRRLLWGHSMGGLNSSILAMNAPELFEKIAMTSPAPISGVSPFASKSEIAAYKVKSKIPEDGVEHMLSQYAYFLGSQESFERMSVVASGLKLLNSKTPPFYISGSVKDTYYYYGITELLSVARRAGVNVQYEERPDGHGDIDGMSLAKFLTL